MLSSSEVTGQYQHLNISLKTTSLFKMNNKVEIHINTTENQSIVSIRSYSIDDKSDSSFVSVDTCFIVSEASLNKLGAMLIELSSTKIYGEMDLSESIVLYDGYRVDLFYGNGQGEIMFSIWSPNYETKERNLTKFYDICKEVLKLTHLKQKEVFR